MRPAWLSVALLLAACGLLPPPAAEEVAGFEPLVPMEPPDGPVLLVGRGTVGGTSWELVAYRSGDGDLCTHHSVDSGGGGGCGESVPDGAIFGPIGTSPIGAGDTILVDALVSGAVRSVRIETSGGTFEVQASSLGAIGFDISAIATALPAGHEPTALVALDAGGQELDRFELLPIAPGGPGVQPTPAGP